MNISISKMHSSPAMVSLSTSSHSRNLHKYFGRNVKATPEPVSKASTDSHDYYKEHRQEQDHALPTPEVTIIDSQKRRSRRRRSKMRTVSEDDALIQRAANPRTGVITPFITGYGNQQCVASDYLAIGKEVAKPSPLVRIARKAVGSGTKARNPINSAVSDADAAVKSATSIRLSQYLPRLEFLHPSHFANMERSYRRPMHLRKQQCDKHAKHTVSTMQSNGKTHQRPHIHRQDGKTSVPRVAIRSGGVNVVQSERPSQLCHCSKCILQSSLKECLPEMPQCLDGRADPASDDGDGEPKSQAEVDLARAKPGQWARGPKRFVCLQILPNTRWIQTRLVEMLCHVFTTLHHASSALQVLKSSKTAKIDEYARALRQMFLASIYLLVLLNLVALFGKVLRFVIKIAALIEWSIKAL